MCAKFGRHRGIELKALHIVTLVSPLWYLTHLKSFPASLLENPFPTQDIQTSKVDAGILLGNSDGR